MSSTAPPCDSCPGADDDGVVSAAVKTCLKCEASFCAEHLRPHLANARFADHVLVAPGARLEERRCAAHGRRLDLFCRSDGSLVCVACVAGGGGGGDDAVGGEGHGGHELSSVEDEHKARKSSIKDERQAAEDERKAAEASVKKMEASQREVEKTVLKSKARISGSFAHMRASLNEKEKEAHRSVEAAGHELIVRIQEGIARHKRQIADLKEASERLEALEGENDPIGFLQSHMEETRRRERATDEIPPPGVSAEEISSLASVEGVIVRLLSFLYGRSPTVVESADDGYGPLLQISSDLRTLTKSPDAGIPGCPETPARRVAALCSPSFSSGRHYWEVDVSASDSYEVGVAYDDDDGDGSGGGDIGTSWSLARRDGGLLAACHGGLETPLAVTAGGDGQRRRLGVHLDRDVGLLSFYDAGSAMLLHSFVGVGAGGGGGGGGGGGSGGLARPLRPALTVGRGSVTIKELDHI
ncbi:unnamed protein product [Lampetra planeri]